MTIYSNFQNAVNAAGDDERIVSFTLYGHDAEGNATRTCEYWVRDQADRDDNSKHFNKAVLMHVQDLLAAGTVFSMGVMESSKELIERDHTRLDAMMKG